MCNFTTITSSTEKRNRTSPATPYGRTRPSTMPKDINGRFVVTDGMPLRRRGSLAAGGEGAHSRATCLHRASRSVPRPRTPANKRRHYAHRVLSMDIVYIQWQKTEVNKQTSVNHVLVRAAKVNGGSRTRYLAIIHRKGIRESAFAASQTLIDLMTNHFLTGDLTQPVSKTLNKTCRHRNGDIGIS